jgi:hypothetical protein
MKAEKEGRSTVKRVTMASVLPPVESDSDDTDYEVQPADDDESDRGEGRDTSNQTLDKGKERAEALQAPETQEGGGPDYVVISDSSEHHADASADNIKRAKSLKRRRRPDAAIPGSDSDEDATFIKRPRRVVSKEPQPPLGNKGECRALSMTV